MKQILKLSFSFKVTDSEGVVTREDRVNRDLEFDEDLPEGFISRLESFFQELLFAYVPGYPFHKKFKVNRLEAKSDDLLLIEYEAGALSPGDLEKIGQQLSAVGFKKWTFIPLYPGRGELHFTAIGKQKKWLETYYNQEGNQKMKITVEPKEDKLNEDKNHLP